MLVGGAGEVEGQLVARDRRLQLQLDVLIGLEDVSRLIGPVLQGRDLGAHATFCVVLHVIGRISQHRRPDLLGELPQAGGAGAVGGELGAEVGPALIGVAHLRDQLVDGVVVEGRGGMITPSSSRVLESAGMEPGVGPPTSAWWARLAAKPRSPTGVTMVMSGRCVPPA